MGTAVASRKSPRERKAYAEGMAYVGEQVGRWGDQLARQSDEPQAAQMARLMAKLARQIGSGA